MSGIKAKISATVDKLTHKSGTSNESPTGYNSSATGTGAGVGQTGDLVSGSDYNTTSGTGAGYGTGTGTGAGYGTTSTGTGSGAGYETGRTGELETGTTAAYGTTGGAVGGTGEVIDSETFTKTEDHEVLIEKKRYELEHRPVQKQYVVETRFVGEQAVAGAPTEVVGTESREVEERIKQAPAGDRTVVVENVDVPAGELRNTTTTGTTGAGYGTTGGNTGSTY